MNNNGFILLADAPPHAEGVSLATLRRWARVGLPNVAPLRTMKRGGRRFTTTAWIEQFFARCDKAAQPVEVEPVRPRQKERKARAKRLKEKHGIGIG